MADILFEIVKRKAPQLGLGGLSQLYPMVMNDARPSFTRGIFLFAETADNEISSFKAASEMIQKDLAAEIFIIHQARVLGSPGYMQWQEKLEYYVGQGRVRPIRANDPLNINTWTESKDLIKFAYEERRPSFYLVAPPFHMLRAFMIAASEAIRHGGDINFFAYPGAPQNLSQVVTHSQGLVKGTRRQLFEEQELLRIKKYTGQSIEPIPRIIEYMKNRKLKF